LRRSFSCFGDFAGYLECFLLHDLVDTTGTVRFFLPFSDFGERATPRDRQSYLHYRRTSMAFVHACNERIREFALTLT
jgi:hypothetical protein